MTFLSGETIIQRLDELIIDENQDPAGNIRQVDCNAYSLRIGPHAYVTNANKYKNPKEEYIQLKNDDSLEIPCGQFGLILTEEFVKVPQDLFGFISIKSSIKHLGLINISGFHVDPGWKGRLLFTVYNAGPHSITLKRGEDAFLIWFAKLDRENTRYQYKKSHTMRHSLTSFDINSKKGEIFSPQVLNKKIEDVSKETKHWVIALIVAFLSGIVIGVTIDWTESYFNYHRGYGQELREEMLKIIENEIKNKKTANDL